MKIGKGFKNYVMITQGFFAVAGYSVIGLIIGLAIGKDTIWPAVLTIVGLIIGLITMFMTIYKFIQMENKKNAVEDGDANEENQS